MMKAVVLALALGAVSAFQAPASVRPARAVQMRETKAVSSRVVVDAAVFVTGRA